MRRAACAGDDALARSLKDSAGRRFINLAGKVDLLTAYAALKRADLFIGNDSGLMHIAAAAGIPTIGLFGPSDERRYGPWGENTVAVRGPRSLDQFLAVDPDLSQAIRHMSDLPVATVVREAKALLIRTAPAAETSPRTAAVEDANAADAAGAEIAPPVEEPAPEAVDAVVEEAPAEERMTERDAS